MRITLIAAIAQNGVIGSKNQLPWSLPDDLRRFKELTTGHTLIMGRKTFESIGRPLPKRRSIVVSRSGLSLPPPVEIAGSIQDALQMARQAPTPGQELFIIGGGEIYAQTLPLADRLLLTLIHQDVEGDAYFPKWDHLPFRETSRVRVEVPIPHSFVTLER